MLSKGLLSERSKAGVKIDKLSKVCDCSQQMARRYVLGEALPDIEIIVKIAKWLNVSPGWLVFGTDAADKPGYVGDKETLVCIAPDLLEYILLKSAPLFLLMDDTKELTAFMMDIINDVTHLEADPETIRKIIDISVHSATRFQGPSHEKNNLQ